MRKIQRPTITIIDADLIRRVRLEQNRRKDRALAQTAGKLLGEYLTLLKSERKSMAPGQLQQPMKDTSPKRD